MAVVSGGLMSKYMNLIIVDLLVGGCLIAFGIFQKGFASLHTSFVYWIGMIVLLSVLYPMKKLRKGPPSLSVPKKPEVQKNVKKETAVQVPAAKIILKANETKIDGLYRLIDTQGKVKVSDAPKLLGVNKKIIEEWAEVLKGHGLIEIHYPTFGSTVYTKRTKQKNG